MGTSPTIAQQQQAQQQFQQFVDNATKNLDAIMASMTSDIQADVTAYYKSFPDYKPLMLGNYQHVSTVTEWSLAAVGAMLGKIKDCLFGGPVPAGSKTTPDLSNLAQNMAGLASSEALILGAAFNAIQGILISLGGSTTTTVQKQRTVKELAPGLTLFLGVLDNELDTKGLISHESIIQTGFVYQVYFSIQQSQAMAKFDQVNALTAEINTANGLIAKCNAAIAKLDPTSDDFDAQNTRYTTCLAKLNDQVADLQKQVQAITSSTSQSKTAQRTRFLAGPSVQLGQAAMVTGGVAVKVIAACTAAFSATAVAYLGSKLIDKFPANSKPSRITITAVPPKIEVEFQKTKANFAMNAAGAPTSLYEAATNAALAAAVADPVSDLRGESWTLSESQLSFTY